MNEMKQLHLKNNNPVPNLEKTSSASLKSLPNPAQLLHSSRFEPPPLLFLRAPSSSSLSQRTGSGSSFRSVGRVKTPRLEPSPNRPLWAEQLIIKLSNISGEKALKSSGAAARRRERRKPGRRRRLFFMFFHSKKLFQSSWLEVLRPAWLCCCRS